MNGGKNMDLSFDIVVMLTGLVLVFAILVLLMLIITVEGKIFDKMNEKKKGGAVNAAKPAAPAAKPAEAAAPAPVVEKGISAEIVAVIAAAVAAMSGGKYTLRAVRRSSNNWGRAGVDDVTSPF